MKISELRDWATTTFGAHSHKEGQVHAALGPLEEWLGHLARQGVNFELTPLSTAAPSAPVPRHDADEPASSGGTDAPVATIEVQLPDASGFVPSDAQGAA